MEFLNITQAKKLALLSYLGTINQSSKLEKNFKVSNVLTYSLYLSPSNISGYDVCPDSTPECRSGCLNTSGLAKVEINAGMSRISDARITKTMLLIEHPEFFMKFLVAEIKSAKLKADKLDAKFSIRLNCTSDVDWSNVTLDGKNIFQIFPDYNFYDYTKTFDKFLNKPSNYHLTYSYTGDNWVNCLRVLEVGYNIAMVFNIPKNGLLPKTYKGIEIVNGDLTDYRINDIEGCIVGLKWKKIANVENNEAVRFSKFAIQPNDKNLVYDILNSTKIGLKSKVA